MDRSELRALQAPLRERYAADPSSADTPLRARADLRDPGVTATVEGWAGPVRAGLHRATGGDGDDACSGDMLLEALVACAGVTLRSVATSMGLDLGAASLTAESSFDARGTLGLDRSVPVGVGETTVTGGRSTPTPTTRPSTGWPPPPSATASSGRAWRLPRGSSCDARRRVAAATLDPCVRSGRARSASGWSTCP